MWDPLKLRISVTAGRIRTPYPSFRKQQAVGSNPTAGSHETPELKRLSRATVKSRFFACGGFDSNRDSNLHIMVIHFLRADRPSTLLLGFATAAPHGCRCSSS